MKLKFTIPAIFALATAALFPLHADDAPVVTSGEVLGYGTAAPASETNSSSAGSIDGIMHHATGVELLKTTDVIDPQLKETFALFYRIDGKPQDAKVRVLVRFLHPEITNPKTGKSLTVDEFEATRLIGHKECSFWTFDNPWEMVPGKWTIQIIYNSKVLAEKTFTVTAPK